MPNPYTALRYIPNAIRSKANPVDLTKEFARKNNASFLAEVARRLQELAEMPSETGATFAPDGAACIGLIGEYGLLGYGCRRAQEILRVDQSPSYWSHAFLFTGGLSSDEKVNQSGKDSAWIWESTLEPATIFNHFSNRNGVSPRRIADYNPSGFKLFTPHCVPNMAVVAIAMTNEERKAILERANDPDVDQLNYDISGLLGLWFAHLSDRASTPNPLSSGNGIFCSAYVQLAYDAAGIDLAPGAHQRNTAPEHIWQSACYLQESFRLRHPDSMELVRRPVQSWFVARDRACVIAPVDLAMPRTLKDVADLASPKPDAQEMD